MKKAITIAMMLLLILVVSCSKKIISTKIEEAISKQETTAEKTTIAEDIYYHASQKSQNGIDAKLLNEEWVAILIMTEDKIKIYDKDNLYKDMVIELNKDLNSDGYIEKIKTGTYKDKNDNEGSFLCILDENSKVILTEVVKNEPMLVHMRDVGNAIFFGTGYGSEYFRQISYKDGKILISYIEQE